MKRFHLITPQVFIHLPQVNSVHGSVELPLFLSQIDPPPTKLFNSLKLINDHQDESLNLQDSKLIISRFTLDLVFASTDREEVD